MKNNLRELVALVSPEDSLEDVIRSISTGGTRFLGVALVVNSDMVLQGLINNGDIIRLIATSVRLDVPAGDVMNNAPVTVSQDASEEQILLSVRQQTLRQTSGRKEFTRYVPVIDNSGKIVDVIDVFSLLARSPQQGSRVEVYGLGFVGLTLATALSNRGHNVSGIDTNESLVNRLEACDPHVFEPRLRDIMKQSLEDGLLRFQTTPNEEHNRVKIIAVGTPLGESGEPSMIALTAVCETVGGRLQRGDIVMLRSTVPVGTTRAFAKNLLEEKSGLVAGEDFNLAFTPERTVEGNAIQELSSLPQIIGGLTAKCAEKAISFWQTLSDSVVRADSLEAAELVKLINNGYRDLSFAFANGLALLADNFNLDATRIIEAANDGYPRNQIPLPSPGVGGYCLTKDPYLYASVNENADYSQLSLLGRKTNVEAGQYPLNILQRYAKRRGVSLGDLNVLVIGLAFKGLPATNDVRNSTGVNIAHELIRRGSQVAGFDAVCSPAEINALGVRFVGVLEGAQDCDAVMILNNHPDNAPEGLLSTLRGREVLVFDGWSMLDRHSVEQDQKLTYATMGYMTPKR